MKKFKIIELFAGIGAYSEALKNLHLDFDIVGISEIDKYALQSYQAIHGEVNNYGDIQEIKKLDYADIWVYSSPCQDISVAGQQKGLQAGTRSSLLYEVGRLLKVAQNENKLPKFLILENVKNLVGSKFKPYFMQ